MSTLIFKKVNLLVSTIASTSITAVSLLAAVELNNRAEAIVVSGNLEDSIVNPGNGFDGVVNLSLKTTLGNRGCSGSLLSSGQHILTAAHCVTDDFGANIFKAARVSFELPTGIFDLNASNIFIHPDWGGFLDFDSFGNDLAILELESIAPQTAERYDIYRNTDELGQVGVKVGYGLPGQGNQGFDPTDFLSVKRFGENQYDAIGEILSQVLPINFIPNTLLVYDFDNGFPQNDALGSLGIPNLGLGLQEVSAAPGDSGGPTFINGLIAGITSGGTCVGFDFINLTCSVTPDIDGVLNASFGEFGFDTRVSNYADYIDNVLAGNIAPDARVPEPNTLFGLGLVLSAFAIHSGFKKRGKTKTLS